MQKGLEGAAGGGKGGFFADTQAGGSGALVLGWRSGVGWRDLE